MAGLAIAYTSQAVSPVSWNIVFTDFTSTDFPRQYSNTAGFGRSQTGALILSGPRFTQKFIWTIDCLIDRDDAYNLDQLYRAWDLDRSNGLSVAVGVNDATFSSAVVTQATFSTAPTFTYASPRKTIVSFGLTEV